VKILKWLLGILVGVVVIAMAVLYLVIDTEAIRQKAVEKFQQETGHSLEIRKPVEWSVFPWLGLKLEDVVVGNAPGFGDEPLARVQVLDVKVGLKPLLERRVAVDALLLQGVHLNLERNEKGVGNWETLARARGSEKAPSTAEAGKKTEGKGFSIDLKGVELDDLDLEYVDRQSGEAYHLEDLQVHIGELKPGVPVPVELALKLRSQKPLIASELHFSSEVTTSEDFRRIDLSALAVKLHAEGEGLPEKGIDLQAAGNLALDLARERLAVSDFSLSGPRVDITGAVSVSGLKHGPRVEGHLALQETNLRELLELAGVELETADPEALTHVSMNLEMVRSRNALTIEPLEVRLDQSRIEGRLAIPSFEGPVVRAQLEVDRIDLDRYLPSRSEETASSQGKAQGSEQSSAEPLDLAPLRRLDADVTIRVGALKASNLTMEKVVLTFTAKQGVIRLDPVGARLYHGSLSASADLDLRRKQPGIQASSSLTGIQIGPLLAALDGKDYLTGTGNLKLDLRTRGLEEPAIRRNLNGDFSIDFRDGAYKGFNLAHAIRKAWAAIKGKTIPDDQPKQTDFAELRGSGVIRKGVIRNEDLYLASPALRVRGKGKVDLVREKVNYLLTVKVVGSLEGQGGKSIDELKGVPIPVRIKGDLASPSPTIDVAALARALAKAKIEEKKGELLEKAGRKIEKKLGVDLLKGFLGN
jgi:AsmA protein